MDIDLSTDASPSPERTLRLAETFAELVRTLNHQTRDHAALEFPSEADRLIRTIAIGVSRLPQLLEQAGRWLAAEQESGRVGADDGTDPETAVAAARIRLDRAREIAHDLANALDFATSVTSHLKTADTGAGGSDDT